MSAADLKVFVAQQIDEAASRIVTQKSPQRDELSFGKLEFYFSMQRFLTGKATTEDLGLFDAINDTLQQLQVVEKDKTFLPRLT